MNKAVDIVVKLYEGSVTSDSGYLALDHVSQTVQAVNVFPRILSELFHPQGNSLVLNVYLYDDRVDLVTLLNHLAGMIDLARPTHVRNMNHPVDAFLKFHKRSIGREVSDLSSDAGAGRIIVRGHVPWIDVQLPQSEGNLLVVLLYSQNDGIDFVPDTQNLAGLGNPLGP